MHNAYKWGLFTGISKVIFDINPKPYYEKKNIYLICLNRFQPNRL